MATRLPEGSRIPVQYGREGIDVLVGSKQSNERIYVSKKQHYFVCVEDSQGEFKLNGLPVRLAQVDEVGKILQFAVDAAWDDEEMKALEWFGLAQKAK